MKNLSILIVLIFCFTQFSYGQTKVDSTDFQEVMDLAEQGQTDKLNEKIDLLCKTVLILLNKSNNFGFCA